VVVLAISYGMGAGSLGSSLGISTKEAQALLDAFDRKFPKVAKFVKENTKEACDQGYVEMTLGDMVRKRRLPFFKGENPSRVYDTYSTNAKIQGTAAIQTKICMIQGNKLCKELSSSNRTFSLLACVHDELLYRVPKEVTKEELKQLANIMVETVKLNNVESGTDGALGNCWGKLKSVEVA
jgi:DNA polymerase I